MHIFVIGTMASHICFWMTYSYQIPPSLVASEAQPVFPHLVHRSAQKKDISAGWRPETAVAREMSIT